MVDESGVEEIAIIATGECTPLSSDCRICDFDGLARFKHPQFGVVTVRFEAKSVMGSFGSVEVAEADWRTFIADRFVDFTKTARTA